MSTLPEIRINSINWHEFSHADFPLEKSEFDNTKCEFLMKATFEVPDKKNRISLFISTVIGYSEDLTSNEELDKFQLLSSLYSFDFYVSNLSNLITYPSDSLLQIQSDLARELLNISYATNRGIIAARTEGTVLKYVPLPVIDPLDLL